MDATFIAHVDDEIELFLLTPRYIQEFSELVGSNREHLAEWLEWARNESDREDLEAYLRKMLERYVHDEAMQLGVRFRGEMAGTVSVDQIDGDLGSCDIGYWLAEGFQGRGIMTRSCEWLLGYLFDKKGINRVQIRVDPRNHRSRAIPRRLGFTHEGTLRHVHRLNDRLSDYEFHSLLRSEWAGSQKT